MRLLFASVFIVGTVACSGQNPAGPSEQSRGLLEGTWRGTLTITPRGSIPVSGPTTWTFTSGPNLSGLSYETTITSQNPWYASQVAAQTTLVPPGTEPAEVHAHGFYDAQMVVVDGHTVFIL